MAFRCCSQVSLIVVTVLTTISIYELARDELRQSARELFSKGNMLFEVPVNKTVITRMQKLNKTISGKRNETSSDIIKIPSQAALLMLKTARTGSTWFCLELNKRGIHISQESLLNWKKLAFDAGVPAGPYLTSLGRAGWVAESLRRPMPKTPFSREVSCDRLSRRRPKLQCWNVSALKTSKKGDGVSSIGCWPPYDQKENCHDNDGCFQQDNYQRDCFHANIKPEIVGTSYNYKEDLESSGIRRESIESILNRQYKHYQSILQNVTRDNSRILVLAHSRTNLVRWRISQAFHQHGRERLTDESAEVVQSMEGKRLRIHDPVRFFTSKAGAQNVLTNLQFALKIDSSAMSSFYEDLVFNLSAVIGEIRNYLGVESHAKILRPDVVIGTRHDKLVSEYIDNFDEVEKILREYPCYHSQLMHPKKDALWTLPLSASPLARETHHIVDHSRPCIILQHLQGYLQHKT